MPDQKMVMNTVWFKDAKGFGRIKSDNLLTQVAIPIPKGGSGEGANPQQLLMSSAIACYALTLAYMLDRKKVPVAGFFMDTEGNTAQGNQLSITHRPHVVLSSDASKEDIAVVESLFLQAEEKCHIGQLLVKAGVPVGTEGKVSIDAGDDLTSNYIEQHQMEW
ncbi:MULTISPECIES: OsmC family protein [Paenibacillus]|uniref:Osmotically inducible protein OsmC n=1 Tax=Paenibacillus amylolyticus TaxID=1451 RepID=A0A1R1BE14_PAEAM|nr:MULTISPECIES: OsmC family protein [Paenibacillus]MBD8836913.1 OsmC family protein [Paenibacillus sp. CFBP 13594]OMF04721.1 osmotically inducible protein OsmC [Paenibacillus amylolyticus]PRA07829.1 osmotically inducible protein OsmC [Paenibacillus sp. MYb63]PRA51473.1 osmotically inducible protein OsmC [Paenibacillus sp. MYb67]